MEDGRDTEVSELLGRFLLLPGCQQIHLTGRAQLIHMFWAEENKYKIILTTKTERRRSPQESTT